MPLIFSGDVLMSDLEEHMGRPEQATANDRVGRQFSLWAHDPSTENQDYLSQQLLTYIGNKRSLLGYIGQALDQVKQRLDKPRLRVLDAFSGSGVVSRFLKAHSSLLISNDLEDYAAVTGRCYLSNRSDVDLEALSQVIEDLNERVTNPMSPGFIEELYAPKNEDKITREDRVFYTKANARRLDNYRRLIDSTPQDMRDMLLAPLLSKASVHANTAGIFKGFYKNRETGIGQFGGSGSDALLRIRGEIKLEVPVLSDFECEHQVYQEDANELASKLRNLDLVYIDPPYNQHPYGSNYFMLNLLLHYERPQEVSRVSGIPTNWNRSGYNVRSRSLSLLRDLLNALDSPFLLISFNNEGFISPEEMHSLLKTIGSVNTIEVQYNAFRGSRNFNNRSIHVTEQLFLVERKG